MVGKTDPIEIGAFMAMQGMDPGGYSTLLHIQELGIVMTKTNERFTRTRSYIKDGKPHLSYEIFLEGIWMSITTAVTLLIPRQAAHD